METAAAIEEEKGLPSTHPSEVWIEGAVGVELDHGEVVVGGGELIEAGDDDLPGLEPDGPGLIVEFAAEIVGDGLDAGLVEAGIEAVAVGEDADGRDVVVADGVGVGVADDDDSAIGLDGDGGGNVGSAEVEGGFAVAASEGEVWQPVGPEARHGKVAVAVVAHDDDLAVGLNGDGTRVLAGDAEIERRLPAGSKRGVESADLGRHLSRFERFQIQSGDLGPCGPRQLHGDTHRS